MPIYAYTCPSCGEHLEVLQNLSGGVPDCPRCGARMKKALTMPGGFILKGSGFYANDYAKGSSSGCCGKENPCDNPKRCCEKS